MELLHREVSWSKRLAHSFPSKAMGHLEPGHCDEGYYQEWFYGLCHVMTKACPLVSRSPEVAAITECFELVLLTILILVVVL